MRKILLRFFRRHTRRLPAILIKIEINIICLHQFLQQYGLIGRYEYREIEGFTIAMESPSESLVDSVESTEEEVIKYIRKDTLTGQWQGFMRYHVPPDLPLHEIPLIAVAMGHDWLPLPEAMQQAYNQPVAA